MIARDDITTFEELMALLGYVDPRAAIKWCATNKIPILKLGLKKYISSHFLTQIIDNQIVTFVKGNKAVCQDNPAFKPTTEIISKYLQKYESASKTHPSKQTKT